MTGWRSIVVLVALLAGCATPRNDTQRGTGFATGQWDGSMDRDGWSRPLFLHIERDGGMWHGKARTFVEGPSIELKQLEIRDDEISFETDSLRFIGRVSGDTFSGTVVDVRTGAPAGEFSLSRDDPSRQTA
jgi:hypothetical protein